MPDQSRPSLMFAASLLSSPRIVRLSGIVSRVSPSAEASTGGARVDGHALGADGVPTSNTAFSMVTQAPAVKACPAGDDGCEGDPPFSSCGQRKLPLVPRLRFTFSCWLY